MSVIEQALRKLEDNRRLEHRIASEYLNPAPSTARDHVGSTRRTWIVGGALATVVVMFGWPELSLLLARERQALSTPAQQQPSTSAADGVTGGRAITPAGTVSAQAVTGGAMTHSLGPAESSSLPTAAKARAPEQFPVSPVVTPSAANAEAAKSPSIPVGWHIAGWISRGAAELQGADLLSAVRTWSAGVQALPKDHPVIVIPHSPTRTAALEVYRRLSERYPAVLLQQTGTGYEAWTVVVIPDRAETGELLAELRSRVQRKALRASTVAALAGNSQGRVGDLAAAADSPLNLPSATARSEQVSNLPVAPRATSASIPPATSAQSPSRPQASNERPAGSGAASDPADPADPARLAQGSAASSADAILRRFSDVERLISRGQHEAALSMLTQVEADVGETWQTRYLQGTAARGLRRWEAAISALSRSHQLNPSSARVLLDRAICWQELGNHEAALKDLRQGLSLNPNMPELVLNEGYSLDALKRTEDAFRSYRKYLEMTAGGEEYASIRTWVSRRISR